jgi:sugar lactone lactonase YvrE
VDSAGNVYVADAANHTIRKVTSAGVVTNLAGLAGSAGSANGTGSAARFYYPWGLAADTNGNVYVADAGNSTIRKVTPVGAVTTLAGLARNTGSLDGTGSAARFYYPHGVTVDTNGNVYVADPGNETIRKVTSAGVVTTLAGLAGSAGTNDGTGSAARFYYPNGLAVDSAGNVYVADTHNETIRKVTPVGANWVVTTLAGLAADSAGSADGTGSAARFNYPCGVAVDTNGNAYVADTHNHTIRKVTPAGLVTTLAGLAGNSGSADGTNSAARFNDPCGMTVDTNGNVYVADPGNHTIRKVMAVGTNWGVTTLAGLAGNAGSTDGTGSAARFKRPHDVAVDSAGNVYVADRANSTIRKVTPVGMNWVVTTLAGSAGNAGSADGTGSAARFNYPNGLAVDSAGNVYVGDSSNGLIRKVTPGGVVTTLAGLVPYAAEIDGTGSAAVFDVPEGVAVDGAGNVYVADPYNNTIRKGFPASSVPAPILQPPSLSAGQFGFGITGLPGLPVNIESAGDLSQWQVVGTCILEGGTNYFVSPDPPLGAQFYRAHVR